MSEAQDLILGGILQTPTRITDVADLDEECFTGDHQKFFVFMVRYYKKRERKNSMDLALARSRLERSTASKKLVGLLLSFVEEYESYSEITDPEFRDALAELVQERKQRLIKDHAGAAIDAIVEGDYRDAEEAMRVALLEIEDADVDSEPPVDIRSAEFVDSVKEETRSDHDDEEGETQSFDPGFDFINDRVSFRRKELTIFGGYSADGKTQVSKTIVLNANRISEAHVLWVALEMSRKEMQTLFVAAHAATIDPAGVRYRQILEGKATAAERKLYQRALDDFKVTKGVLENRGAPGRLEIWSPNKPITFAKFKDRARAVKRERGLDILCIDYLELVEPGDLKGDYRHVLKQMIQGSKAIARELDLWHLVLHQISRKGRDEAEKRNPNHYIQRDLGESAGVERAADSILWSFTDQDHKDDKTCKVGIAKARKGDTLLHGRYCHADFAKAIIGEIDDDDL